MAEALLWISRAGSGAAHASLLGPASALSLMAIVMLISAADIG